jgi:hypothetical protein
VIFLWPGLVRLALLLVSSLLSTLPQPSLFGASLTSKMVRSSSLRTRSSLSILFSVSEALMPHDIVTYLESIRASSPSTCSDTFGVFAGRTKWLSQCGQYSSLAFISPSATLTVSCTHASSNSRASFRKAFLHFLHMKVMSNVCMSGWSLCSWWHSAQSNHFLPAHSQQSSYIPSPDKRTAWRADGDLGVEDVLAACASASLRR